MGRVVKAVLMAVVVTALVIVTAGVILSVAAPATFTATFGAIGSGTLLGTIVGSTAFITGVALAGAGALVTSLIAKDVSSGFDGNGANFGSKVSGGGVGIARQIIYGKARVGGTFAHIETSGTDGAFLNLIIVVSGHPVAGYEKIFYNDLELTTVTANQNGETVYYATNTDLRDTSSDNPNTFSYGGSVGYLCRFTFHDGTQTAVDGFAQAQLGTTAFPNTHKFTNCAYFFFQCAIDAEKNSTMPKLSFLIKGKNVHDPRTGGAATTDAQRSNPALCVNDYLTDTTYGLKAKTDEVNQTTNAGGISAAANICDQLVTLADGSTTQTRYTANGFTSMQASGESVLEGLLGAMAGKMTFTNGKFQCFAGASQTPEFTITDADALGPYEIITKKRGGDLFNQVKAMYPDSSQKYVATETPVLADANMLLADTPVGDRIGGAGSPNFKKELEIRLPYTTDTNTAQRIQKIQLLDQRQTTRLAVRVPIKYVQCQPNDWIYVTNARLGFSSKLFQIEDMSLEMDVADDGGGALASVSLSLRETDSSVFGFATSDYTAPVTEGSDRPQGAMTLTAPVIGTPVASSLVDGPTVKINVTVNWTNSASDDVTGTEVQYKLSGGTYASSGIAGKGQTSFIVADLKDGQTYTFRVRHTGQGGVFSDYSGESSLTPSHSDSLSAPSSVTIQNTKPLALSLSWTNPSNTNLRSIKIYESTSSVSTNPSENLVVASVAGEPSKKMTITRGSADGLNPATTYYYRLRAVTHTGQQSSVSSQVSAAFAGVTDSVADFTMAGFFKLDVAGNTNAPTDSAFNTAFGRFPMDGDFVIVQNTSASPKVSKSYKYSGASSGGGGGSFAEVTNLITGDQVVTGTIGADKIIANSLTSASGVFGAIDANIITTGTLNADKINIDGVTLDTSGNQLVVGTIASGNIGLNAVLTEKMIANAVTISGSASLASNFSLTSSYQTVVSTSWTSTGAPTSCFFNLHWTGQGNVGDYAGTARLMHDTSIIKTISLNNDNNRGGNYAIFFNITPSAGANSISISAAGQTSGDNITFQSDGTNLFFLETKR